MSVQPRPADPITEDYLLLGLPVVEFSFSNASGGFDPYFGLGIVDSAEIQKALQFAQLRSAQSGTSKLVRELVRQVDNTIQVGTFRHNGANMQLRFASAGLASIDAASVAIAADAFRLTSDQFAFLDLANQLLVDTPAPVFSPGTVTDEAVGTGQGGSFGETTGDFALDYKINAIGDVTAFTVGGVDRSGDLVAGSTPTAGQIGILTGTGATSGQITFPSGEAPASGAALVGTYTPSFTIANNTEAAIDYNGGRVRIVGPYDGATDRFRTGQPMSAAYTYSQPDLERIQPFTQFVFAGRARVRQLTDVGSNVVWQIPKTQVRLTEDAFVFNRDEFTVTPLAIQLLEDDADPTKPFGDLDIYREGTF